MTDRAITETVDRAREGETSGRMRWVLVWTMVLSIAAVGAAWLAIA